MAVSGDKINRMINEVRAKCDALDDDTRKKLDDNMAIDFEEHFKFQELQAHAHAGGILSMEAAQVVYVALGEVGSDDNGGWAAGTDLATKTVVTQLMGELLTLRMRQLVR